jgi:antirestriction protein ArdC
MPFSRERPTAGLPHHNKESGQEKVTTYDTITEKITKRLEEGDIPWKKPWKAQLPGNLITNKPYRGMNFLLLGSEEYASSYWLTFKQAQDKGGHVKKGEKGTLVTFWKVTEKELGNRSETPHWSRQRSRRTPGAALGDHAG